MSDRSIPLAHESLRSSTPWRLKQLDSRRRPDHEHEHPTLGPETILHLQRQAGNAAVADLLAGGVSTLGRLVAVATQLLAKAIATGVEASENQLTDQLFWQEHPSLRGEKLQAGSPETLRWLRIRDTVVRPLLRTHPKPGQSEGSAPTTGASHRPAGMVPVDQVAAQSGGSTATAGGKSASTSDKYFVQDVGQYQDIDEAGKTRVWQYGSSGENICNMTSLTMGLVSMAGEAEVRTRIIALLRSKGMHAGAEVNLGSHRKPKWVPLDKALDDPKVAERIDLLDLVTAAAIGQHGTYQDVTLAGTIARIARESGLATKSESVSGQPKLETEKGRAMAAELLVSGKRVIVGTVNHYVYLIEVRGDGVIVHDPAGARVEPSLARPIFLHRNEVSDIAVEWSTLDSTRRERAVRRISTNAQAATIVNRLGEISAMAVTEHKSALAALAKEHRGDIAMGASNFYATNEFSENKLRLMVSLVS
jgi:hypothetical protein